MGFTGVLVKRTNGVGSGWQGEVVELDRAVGDSSEDEGIVRFRPSYVVNAVRSVERSELGDGLGGVEVKDVDTAVSEDAEVLGGADGQTVLVKWTEFHGVAVKWGFKYRHNYFPTIG